MTAHKSLRTLRRLFVGMFLVFLSTVIIVLIVAAPPLWLVLAFVGLAVLVALMVWLHARSTHYRCPNCRETFALSSLNDFISPHYPNKKLVNCPHCGTTAWCVAQSRRDG